MTKELCHPHSHKPTKRLGFQLPSQCEQLEANKLKQPVTQSYGSTGPHSKPVLVCLNLPSFVAFYEKLILNLVTQT